MSPLLQSILREMAATLREKMVARAKERLADSAVFIATARGEIAAIDNAVHLGPATEMTASLLGSQGIPLQEGDSAISNDPYLGSAHVQDFFLLSPVYDNGAPVFYLGAKCHLPDIGGDVQGGFNSRAEEIWAEGVRISPVKVCREGRVDTGIFNMILLNTRTADAVRFALESIMAAAESGKKEISGAGRAPERMETLRREAEAMLAATETRVRQLVSSWHEGEYAGECQAGNGDGALRGIKLAARLAIGGSDLVVDLSMNPPQLKRPFNSPRGNTLCFASMPLFAVFPDDLVVNGGIWRGITVKTKKGTLIDPVLPAPTSFSPFHVGSEIAGSVRAAMEKILAPEEKKRLAARLPSLLAWHPKV